MRLSAFVVALFLVGGAAIGRAQAEDSQPARGVIRLGPVDATGHVQEGVTFVLRRSDSGYRVEDPRASFVDEVVRSVRQAPF